MSSSEAAAMRSLLLDVLRWSQERDYRGHSKHDALNSPFLRALTFENRFLRLAVTQAVMRFPVNTRSLFGVPRLRNPKGIGLFAHAWLDLAENLRRRPGEGVSADECRREASGLLTWLVEQASPQAGPSAGLRELFGLEGGAPSTPGAVPLQGLGWGYHYDWQDKGFFQPAHFPNRVVSCWIGFAFLRAFEITGEEKFLAAAREIAVFLLENPRRLVETADQLCLSYVPLEDIDWAVMDVSALVAAFCAKLARLGGGEEEGGLLGDAKRLMEFVVDKQTDYGAWFYTWPAGDSHIRHDNYHTGIILDCLADYMTYSGDHSCRQNYHDGLDYYRRHLFLESGAPRWMNDRTWPHDVHGSAAGILSFSRASRSLRESSPEEEEGRAGDCLDFADRILKWTQENLYSGRGYFFYQKTRWMTKRFCLMRWGNAWMCRAIAYRLTGEAETRESKMPAS